jgi:hypothetical protein
VGMARVWRDGGIASGCPSARPYPSPATVWGCWWSSRDLKLKQREGVVDRRSSAWLTDLAAVVSQGRHCQPSIMDPAVHPGLWLCNSFWMKLNVPLVTRKKKKNLNKKRKKIIHFTILTYPLSLSRI